MSPDVPRDIQAIIDSGYEFNLRYEHGTFTVALWQSDWPSGLYNSIELPHFDGTSLMDTMHEAALYATKFPKEAG